MKLFRYSVCILLFCSLFLLPAPNEGYLFLESVRRATDGCLAALEEGHTGANPPPLRAARLAATDIPEGVDAAAVERSIRRTVVMDHDRVFVGTDGIPWRKVEGQLRPVPPPAAEALRRGSREVEISVERTPQ